MYSETKCKWTGAVEPGKQDYFHDPRLRRLPLSAPPPPRISTTPVTCLENKPGWKASFIPVPAVNSTTTQARKSENASMSADENQVAAFQSNTTYRSPSPYYSPYSPTNSSEQSEEIVEVIQNKDKPNLKKKTISQNPDSPYSPTSSEKSEEIIEVIQNKDKPIKLKTKTTSQNSADLIGNVSTFLKTKEHALETHKRNFSLLRKCYDSKKVKLRVVQDKLEEVRNEIDVLKREKEDMQYKNELDRAKLEEELNKVNAELKTLKDENQGRSTQQADMHSKLQFAQAAVKRQKILTEKHASEVCRLEKENSELKQVAISQSDRIRAMENRINVFEAAIRQDVNDKKTMFDALKHYMGNAQTRIKKLAENCPGQFGNLVTSAKDGLTSSSTSVATVVKMEDTEHCRDAEMDATLLLSSSNRDAATATSKERTEKRSFDDESTSSYSDTDTTDIVNSPSNVFVWKQNVGQHKKFRHP